MQLSYHPTQYNGKKWTGWADISVVTENDCSFISVLGERWVLYTITSSKGEERQFERRNRTEQSPKGEKINGNILFHEEIYLHAFLGKVWHDFELEGHSPIAEMDPNRNTIQIWDAQCSDPSILIEASVKPKPECEHYWNREVCETAI